LPHKAFAPQTGKTTGRDALPHCSFAQGHRFSNFRYTLSARKAIGFSGFVRRLRR
jgi:hypothetical protein